LPVPALGVIPPVSNPTLDLVFPPAPAPIPSGQLDFGDVWVGEPEEQDFTVVNLGDLGSFLRGTAAVSSVVDVDSDGDVDAADAGYFICFPASDCDYTNGVTTASSRAVTIQTTAPMTPGPYSTQITFTGINTVPQSSITRTVLGNAIVPVFQLGGNGLNFGNVVVKPPTSFRELTLRFRNDGLINLGPDTLMMPFPEYTCSVDGGASFQVSCPADLSPGFVNNILIRFTPTAVAAFNGEAFLFGHDTVRFMFTGAGVLGTFQFKDQ
ncbi:MAG: hypothetical protein Q7S86_02630, partial [bacterium]|nr:hypothetical protein [bacterium]